VSFLKKLSLETREFLGSCKIDGGVLSNTALFGLVEFLASFEESFVELQKFKSTFTNALEVNTETIGSPNTCEMV
jgi:hypothetical protein